MHILTQCDVWTPSRESDSHLARTILSIRHGPDGEYVEYWFGGANGDMSECRGETFRQWISKMKANRSVDMEWVAIFAENES
jgi:hypothetical protein